MYCNPNRYVWLPPTFWSAFLRENSSSDAEWKTPYHNKEPLFFSYGKKTVLHQTFLNDSLLFMKLQSRMRCARGDPPPLKAKALPSSQKVMISVFWDTARVLGFSVLLAQGQDDQLRVFLQLAERRSATTPEEPQTRQTFFQANSANGQRHPSHRIFDKGVACQFRLGDLAASPLFA